MMNPNFYKITSKYSKWFGPAVVGLLIIITLLAYVKVFRAEFVYDDYAFIVNNKDIQNFKPFSKFFLSPNIFTGSNYHTETGGGKNWRPIASLAFAAQYASFGKNPSGFHFTSILLHIFNLILVYILAMKLTRRIGIAAITTAFWALHPTATEAVSWVANQSSLIFFGFFILAVLALFKFTDNYQKKYLFISYLFFGLSLLSKETALGGIFIILFIFLFYLKKHWKLFLPFVLMSLFYFYARYKILGALGDHASRGGFLENILLAPTVFYKYISLAVYPVNLLLNYANFPLPSGIGDPRVIAGILLFSVSLLLFYVGLKKFKFNFVIGIVWFVAFLLPVLQIIPFQDIVGERFLYAPLAGFFLAAVLGLDNFLSYIKSKFNQNFYPFGKTVAAIALILFFILTFNRNNDWLNSENLWNSVLIIDPVNQKALSNLTGYYISQGKTAKIIETSEKLLKINPDDIGGHINLGVGLAMAGRLEEAESKFLYAISKKPDYQPALINLAVIYQNTGRYDKALEIIKNLNKKYPDDEDIKQRLAQLENIVKYNKPAATDINLVGEGENYSYIESELQGPAIEGNIVNSGIYGKVITVFGAPFEASIDVFSANDASKTFISIRTHSDGTFQIPLRPGSYFLKPIDPDGPMAPAQEKYPINIGSGRWLQIKIEYIINE
ncbi:MAG: tetratricopeptide repeat protein [Parcubacteria group bacterium]|nr:tetratricopeptide repeat protein [Parcubacteria group bacterium]